MKRIFIIALLIILGLLIYFELQTPVTEEKPKKITQTKPLNKTNPTDTIVNSEFHPVYDILNKTEAKKWKAPKISLKQDTLKTNLGNINLEVKINTGMRVDIFLFINYQKEDMFFQVTDGNYHFNNINLLSDTNRVYVVYSDGKYRSPIDSLIVIKQ